MKIDFHIIHYNEPKEWIDHQKEHIEYHGHNCHIVPGKYLNILDPRVAGYGCGNNDYVSFVDPDDPIDLSQLPNVEHPAWYTNSYVQRGQQITPLYKHNKWTWEWHQQSKLPIHQIAVVRRDIMENAIHDIFHSDFYAQLFIFIDNLIWAYVAKHTPWFFYSDAFPYTWIQHKQGLHRKTTDDEKRAIRDYASYITPLWK